MKNRINHQIEHKQQPQQLTLTLPAPALDPRLSSLDSCRNRHLNRSRRLRRAAAWFAHMRHVVDLAPDPTESSSLGAPKRSDGGSSSSLPTDRSETSDRSEKSSNIHNPA